jgi:hypothetical protein
MNSVDYTPVILAQLTDLQMRVTKQEATISALKAEVERLTGSSVNVNHTTMKMSVPLRQHSGAGYNTAQEGRPSRSGDYRSNNESRPPRGAIPVTSGSSGAAGGGGATGRTRPRMAPALNAKERTPHPTMSLSDVLEKDEVVTIQVGTGKDADGNFTNTTATAVFGGADLNVTECELVASLVGMKSSKPGEILYKFIAELEKSGHIKKTFSAPPWRLCFVERNGVRKSLEELRTTVG